METAQSPDPQVEQQISPAPTLSSMTPSPHPKEKSKSNKNRSQRYPGDHAATGVVNHWKYPTVRTYNCRSLPSPTHNCSEAGINQPILRGSSKKDMPEENGSCGSKD